MHLKGIIADRYGRIGRVMSAYNDDKIYSIELVGAVCRRYSHSKNLHGLAE